MILNDKTLHHITTQQQIQSSALMPQLNLHYHRCTKPTKNCAHLSEEQQIQQGGRASPRRVGSRLENQ